MQPTTTGRTRRAIGLGAAMMMLSGLVLAGLATSATGAVAGVATTQPPKILLALGDSLALGMSRPLRLRCRPSTRQLYRDEGYSAATHRRGLRRSMKLIDLGCPGETTASMLGTLHSHNAARCIRPNSARTRRWPRRGIPRSPPKSSRAAHDRHRCERRRCVCCGNSLNATCVENHVNTARRTWASSWVTSAQRFDARPFSRISR